jgi:hypothetical protein
MATHPIFDLLLEGVNDELERKVLSALIKYAGKRLSRPNLVLEVQGIYVKQVNIYSSQEDRRNREAIERLQRKGYPIIASSGQTGYMLGGNEAELDEYVRELASRKMNLEEKIKFLNGSKKWIPFIRQWITHRPIYQEKLF